MATATKSGQNLSFTYNADGLRTTKTVNGVVHTYYYSGSKLVRETYGDYVLDFFYDQNGHPFMLLQNGNIYYYITNAQGDVIRLVDINGNTAASYRYDPYGKAISALGSHATINPLRYRGYVFDHETGLYYLQSRYYDPEIGRFINADNYPSTGQGLTGNNMFAYCGNNPISREDVTGNGWHVLISAAISGTVSMAISMYQEFNDGVHGVDFLKILVSTTCGSGEGALVALKPELAVPICATIGVVESVANNLLDNAFVEQTNNRHSTTEIIVDAITAGGTGALSAMVGGSNAAKGSKIINEGIDASGKLASKGLHPATKKIAAKAVKAAKKYIKNTWLTNLLEECFYTAYSEYASGYTNEWIGQAYGE